jgi:ribosomal protein S18 acetylase RimI-like enzyme
MKMSHTSKLTAEKPPMLLDWDSEWWGIRVGWADIVLVEDRDGGPVGYVTVHLKGETSSIGLIAVAEEHRGKGVGQALVSSAVDWARSRKVPHMSVVTQGRNIEAQRTFQRAGFLTTKTQLWFHRRHDLNPPSNPGSKGQ